MSSLDAVAGGRDRVLDLTKSCALLVVVVAHALAWDVSTGEPASVLDLRPELRWVTWLLQVLPLFFAAGAVSNLASWRRHPNSDSFVRRRIGRLATPAVLYAAVWTALLLPAALWFVPVELVGRYLAQLLWFLGVYAAIVVAVPVTARYASHPARTLGIGLVAIVAVDMLRWQVAPALGWVNMLLVWGWLHQLGYSLPTLRTVGAVRLLLAGCAAVALALATAVLGPYSTSMVSTTGDPGLSNLSPPTVVLALYGLGQVLVLAAAWPLLDRLMQWRPAWYAVAGFGSRAVEVYLWHIPIVAVVIAVAWVTGLGPAPLGPAWWALHLTVVAVVVPVAWLLAGPMGRASRRLLGRVSTMRAPVARPIIPAALVSAAIVALSHTGFATWWGPGLLGITMATLPLTLVLVAAWWMVSARVGADDRGLALGNVPDLPGRNSALGQ